METRKNDVVAFSQMVLLLLGLIASFWSSPTVGVAGCLAIGIGIIQRDQALIRAAMSLALTAVAVYGFWKFPFLQPTGKILGTITVLLLVWALCDKFRKRPINPVRAA